MKRSPIRSVSRKQAARLRLYTQLRKQFLAEHTRCEFPGGCGRSATTIQHLRGRSGERLNDMEQWAASCLEHNLWAEDHTGDALEIGWLIRIEGSNA